MLLGLEAEGVHVDALDGRHMLVVLVGLHQGEVGAAAGGHAVMAIELELGRGNGVVHVGTEGSQVVDVGGNGVGVGGEIEPLLGGRDI